MLLLLLLLTVLNSSAFQLRPPNDFLHDLVIAIVILGNPLLDAAVPIEKLLVERLTELLAVSLSGFSVNGVVVVDCILLIQLQDIGFDRRMHFDDWVPIVVLRRRLTLLIGGDQVDLVLRLLIHCFQLPSSLLHPAASHCGSFVFR